MELYKLNYPVETADAKKFWGSNHKCNRMKAIMAFSLNLENANDNYRRYGYTRAWRAKALAAFKEDVNKPKMENMQFYELSDAYWDIMPYVPPTTLYSDEELIEWAENIN